MSGAARKSWEQDVDRGWKRELFEHFEEEGEAEIRRRYDSLNEDWKAHAKIWLRRRDEERDAEAARRATDEARRNTEELILQRRAVAAAEDSAAAAAQANDHARRARMVSWWALGVSIAGTLLSVGAAIFGKG